MPLPKPPAKRADMLTEEDIRAALAFAADRERRVVTASA